MIDKQHNDNTKQFFQKLMLFIDATITSTISADQAEKNQILVRGLLNVRDGIFAEIIRDNISEKIQTTLKQTKENKKKQELKNRRATGQNDLNLDPKSDGAQKASGS